MAVIVRPTLHGHPQQGIVFRLTLREVENGFSLEIPTMSGKFSISSITSEDLRPAFDFIFEKLSSFLNSTFSDPVKGLDGRKPIGFLGEVW